MPTTVNAAAQQEIRVAAVLNGGVSLAIWMSGVTLELEHLALASQGIGSWDPYKQLLDLLGATARVDVIAGTSAGGVNGAFLALGLAHNRDLTLLRDVWTRAGSLEALLRKGDDKAPVSLLKGDDYFLPEITKALHDVVDDQGNPQLGPTGHDPIDLILTGTLWSGRETPFTDDMGVGINERDYDALFSFTRATLDDRLAVIPQLASAARCTSSFPAAFEPHWVEVTAPEQSGPWPSTAGLANFRESQYVLDGGVLLNKPIRPALEAIYRQTGEKQVRRVLTYVVPDPSEKATTVATGTPAAGDVLLSVLTRLKSTDSVSAELSEIRDRNISVRSRRRARGLLSQALLECANLPEALWEGYREERLNNAATVMAGLMYAGQPAGSNRWSERELAAGLVRYARSQPTGFPFVPSGLLPAALAFTPTEWTWGQTTVARIGDLTVDFLKRVLWFAKLGDALRTEVVACRSDVADVLAGIAADRRSLDHFWADAARGTAAGVPALPDRKGGSNLATTNAVDLDTWLDAVVPAWDAAVPSPTAGQTPAQARHVALYGQALQLAAVLSAHRTTVLSILGDPNLAVVDDGAELSELQAFGAWLLLPPTPEGVLRQMLQLDVVQFATAGATSQAEQEVELVQVSCSNPSAITGMQLHHFGAFYRAPWRVNDWIEGRLDGAKQVMRFLLAPERLRQLGFSPTQLLASLRGIAVPAGHPDEQWLAARWQGGLTGFGTEVAGILSGGTGSVDGLADALAMPLRLQILTDDLKALATAIREELTDADPRSSAWLVDFDALPNPTAADLWSMREGMSKIGQQQIGEDVGSDTFARTVSHAATVAAGTFAVPSKATSLKAVQYSLAGLRGYTALVWTMVSYLTRGSAFGTRLFELVVAVGGALVALTLLVPGVPLGVTFAGVLILAAGVTAAGLRTPDGSWFGVRLGIAAFFAALVEGGLVWRDIDSKGWSGSSTLSTLIKAGVVVALVLLGGYIARARPSKRELWWTVVILALTVAGVVVLSWQHA